MLPTRKQFKDFIAAIRHAQEKEDKLDKAFELIWDDDQAQHVPFYISPLWDAIYLAFNIMFDCEDIEGVGNELAWWFEWPLKMMPYTQSTALSTISATSMLSMTI